MGVLWILTHHKENNKAVGLGYCIIDYIVVNCTPVLLIVRDYGQRKCICHVEAKCAVLYNIYLVYVITINISSKTYALCDKSFMTRNSYMFRHQDAVFRSSLQRKYVINHANLVSTSPYRNDQNLKMLIFVKLLTINCSIMILNIEICSNKPPQLLVFSCCCVFGGCTQTAVLCTPHGISGRDLCRSYGIETASLTRMYLTCLFLLWSPLIDRMRCEERNIYII
jgi:hypothetical protein